MNYCQFRNDFIKRMCNSVKPLLPPEYQQVEYLQSSGTQYLNIGAAKNHQYYLVDFMQLNGVYSNKASQWNLNTLLGYNNYGSDCKMWLRYRSPYEIIGTLNDVIIGYASISLNTLYEYYISPTSFTLNGVDYTTATTGDITSNVNVYVFAINDDYGHASFFSALRLYHLKTSSINLYPCYRKSDNKPGMYDTVNKEFYTNAGTGADFTVGNNV